MKLLSLTSLAAAVCTSDCIEPPWRSSNRPDGLRVSPLTAL